jgi:hypothetical protein
MRDALEFEWLGIPSVAVIADALTGPADAMRRLSGMPDHPYLVTAFPVGALTPDAVRERARSHVAEVLALLRDRPAAPPVASAPGDTAAGVDAGDDLVFPDDGTAHLAFAEQGWTDGMAVELPTPERVAALLATTGRPPDEVLLRIATRNDLDATVSQIAANAAMAGLEPRHFPVVLAALEAMADERHNLHAHTATMAGAQQLVVVRGPAARALGYRSEDGALGPGWPANNRTGRAVRLVIRNLLRSVHGEFDRAGFSHPGRFGWCVAEDHRSPWLLGAPDQSEVLVYATTWQASVINHEQTAAPLLDELALAIRTACHVNWLHRDVATASDFFAARPFLVVTGREHATVLVRDGYDDLTRLRESLFERLVDPGSPLRPVAIASPQNLHVLYLHATGMQQSWFFAPFQSHVMTRRPLPDPPS